MKAPHGSKTLQGNQFTAICPRTSPPTSTRIFILVRAFGKSCADMAVWKQRMERIFSPLTESHAMKNMVILFVIPASREKNLSLHKIAGKITVNNAPVLPLTVMEPKGHVGQFWTSCLNAGVAYAANIVPHKAWEHAAIVPMSFDTDLNEEYARRFAECLRTETNFISRRTIPASVAYVPEILVTGEPLIKIKKIAESIKDHTEPSEATLSLLINYHRNTLARWQLSTFEEIGMFNPACNYLNGMEDMELLIRILLDAEANYPLMETDIRYDDIRLKELERRDSERDKLISAQRQKMNSETRTLKAIWHCLACEWIMRGKSRMNRSPHEAEFTLMSKLS